MKMPRSREVGRLVSIHAGDHQPLPNPEAEQAMTFEDDSWYEGLTRYLYTNLSPDMKNIERSHSALSSTLACSRSKMKKTERDKT